MNATERAKILDRLAAGEITAAEAMSLLDRPAPPERAEPVAEKAWPTDNIPVEELKPEAIKIESPAEEMSIFKPAINGDDDDGGKPRWLKIRVRNRTNGHNKVSITPVSYTHLDVYKRQRHRGCCRPVQPY